MASLLSGGGMRLLPIDPAMKDDTHYRYKMPGIDIKIEGSGNGIKTVFPNMREVGIALNRPESAINKYIGYRLGAQSTNRIDKYLVMGSFTRDRIQEIIYDFISDFVLCKGDKSHPGCRNPETGILNLKAGKDKKISKKGTNFIMRCGACGVITKLPLGEKIIKDLEDWAANYVELNKTISGGDSLAAAMDVKAEAEKTIVPAGSATTTGVKREDFKMDETATDMTEVALAAKAKLIKENETDLTVIPPLPEIKKEAIDPIVELSKVFDDFTLKRSQKLKKLIKIKTDCGVADIDVARLIIRAAFLSANKTPYKPVLAELRKAVPYLKTYIETKKAANVTLANLKDLSEFLRLNLKKSAVTVIEQKHAKEENDGAIPPAQNGNTEAAMNGNAPRTKKENRKIGAVARTGNADNIMTKQSIEQMNAGERIACEIINFELNFNCFSKGCVEKLPMAYKLLIEEGVLCQRYITEWCVFFHFTMNNLIFSTPEGANVSSDAMALQLAEAAKKLGLINPESTAALEKKRQDKKDAQAKKHAAKHTGSNETNEPEQDYDYAIDEYGWSLTKEVNVLDLPTAPIKLSKLISVEEVGKGVSVIFNVMKCLEKWSRPQNLFFDGNILENGVVSDE